MTSRGVGPRGKHLREDAPLYGGQLSRPPLRRRGRQLRVCELHEQRQMARTHRQWSPRRAAAALARHLRRAGDSIDLLHVEVAYPHSTAAALAVRAGKRQPGRECDGRDSKRITTLALAACAAAALVAAGCGDDNERSGPLAPTSIETGGVFAPRRDGGRFDPGSCGTMRDMRDARLLYPG